MAQALRPLRPLLVDFLHPHPRHSVRRERRVPGLMVCASAMETAFGGGGGTSVVVIVFDDAEEQGGVDVGVLHVGGALESMIFCGWVGRGYPICERRDVALAILPPRLHLAYSYLDVPSWSVVPLVWILRGDASLTTRQHSERRLRTVARMFYS